MLTDKLEWYYEDYYSKLDGNEMNFVFLPLIPGITNRASGRLVHENI